MAVTSNTKRSRGSTGPGRALVLMAGALALAGCDAGVDANEPALERQAALGEPLDTSPKRSWMYYGLTGAEVEAKQAEHGARITSLQVESTSPVKFTVVMERDDGAHPTQWWYYGCTEEYLNARLTENGARLTSLVPYVVNGTVYFAATMIRNSGNDWRLSSWWYGLSWGELQQKLAAENARPIDLRQYDWYGQRRYAAVFISFDGITGQAYQDLTSDGVRSVLANTGVYAIALEPSNAAGTTYNLVVNYGNQGAEGWYYLNELFDPMWNSVVQHGHRLLDVKSFFVNGERRFVGLAIDNQGPEAAAVRQILRNDLASTGGRFGFYLKPVDLKGAGELISAVKELEWLAEKVKFEPASALKILVAVRVLRVMEQSSTWSVSSPIGYADAGTPGRSCPEPRATDPVRGATVGDLLRRMLVDSDNWATRALIDKVAGGFAGVNQAAADAGMTSTNVASYFGCYPFLNTTTMEDLGRLYQGIANLTIFTTGASRDVLYANMPGNTADSAGVFDRVKTIVKEEAASMGFSTAALDRFNAELKVHYKGGSNTFISGTQSSESRSMAGLITIPHCNGTNSRTFHADTYTWGVYLDQAKRVVLRATATGDYTQADQAADDAKAEPLRKPIRNRLQAWKSCGF